MKTVLSKSRTGMVETELHSTTPLTTKKTTFQLPPRVKKLRYNDVPTTYPPSPPPFKNSFYPNGQFAKSKFVNLLQWHKQHPALVMTLTYISIFIIGLALGFTPFLKVYVNSCQEDKRVLTDMIESFQAEKGMLREAIESFQEDKRMLKDLIQKFEAATLTRLNTTMSHMPTPRTGESVGPSIKKEDLYNMVTQINQVVRKQLEVNNAKKFEMTRLGVGNNKIALTCSEGSLKVTNLELNGISGEQTDVDRFNEYCRKNADTSHSSTRCMVNLQSVYESSEYPDDMTTQVTFTCSVK